MTSPVDLWVVLVAGVPGVAALVLSIVLFTRLHRVQAAQRVLLPDGAQASVTERQAALQHGMDRLDAALAELRTIVDTQRARTEAELSTALRFQGLVRYDAYRDMGGRQSWSLALVDGTGTGAVVTSLHARDHARVYLKEITAGETTQRLSPEERHAVSMAIGREPGLAGPPAGEDQP